MPSLVPEQLAPSLVPEQLVLKGTPGITPSLVKLLRLLQGGLARKTRVPLFLISRDKKTPLSVVWLALSALPQPLLRPWSHLNKRFYLKGRLREGESSFDLN